MLQILEHDRDGILNTLFGNVNHCIVVVDQNGLVSYMNDSYCNFLEVNKEKVKGQHVTNIIENSRMHIVVETGEEEIADLQYIRGNYMIAHRIPLSAGGDMVGALGIVLFRDTGEWLTLNSHIRELFLEMQKYHNQRNNEAAYGLQDIISCSSEMLDVKNKIKKVAPGDVSILLRGESGTGKELFAHSIHQLSERNSKPFVKVNCAAIPEHLLESELFGYQDGAFTGAKKGGKPGKFQLADGGTIFLDEIGDMPLHAQVKMLRVLHEGEIEPLGALDSEKVDVRIVAATNQPLEELIEAQKFREDLFYRINVVQIDIPPLRKRPDDLRLLAKYLLDKVTARTGKRVLGFSRKVHDCFLQYQWPGNVRELENIIEAAVHLTNNEIIEFEDLPSQMNDNLCAYHETLTLKEIMEKTEEQVIHQTLKKTEGDKTEAARMLGIGKSSLYDKLKKYQ